MTTDSIAAPAPGETREQQDKRLRARMRAPADADPLAGTFVLGHHTVDQEHDSKGRRLTIPRTLHYDQLADKRTMRVVAYRDANGAVEWVGGSSEPTSRVIDTVPAPQRKPQDPDAKRTDKIIDRFVIEPKRDTIIDDDGTERVVVRRVRGGY